VLLGVRTTRALRRGEELVAAERLRIARDLHDVVGHGLGAITVQAGAARMAIAKGATDDATQAMLAVEAAGRGVLREVRWLVGLLREDTEHPALRDVPTLVGNARRCGMAVSLSVTGNLDAAPSPQGEAAYRVIQEALTNTLRHADGREAHVDIELGSELSVRVSDNGAGASDHAEAAEASVGNGIRGIHERVQALGGTARTGRVAGLGWVVQARLPLGRVR
jgi:signal transduction histidine kinase